MLKTPKVDKPYIEKEQNTIITKSNLQLILDAIKVYIDKIRELYNEFADQQILKNLTLTQIIDPISNQDGLIFIDENNEIYLI